MTSNNPVMPRNKKNPVGGGRIQRSAGKVIRSKMKLIQRDIITAFNKIPYTLIDADTGFAVNNNIYRYELSAFNIQSFSEMIDRIIKDVMLAEGSVDNWFMNEFISLSYANGTAESVVNLNNLFGDLYGLDLLDVISSSAYIDRISYSLGRVFELMEGFTAEMKTDLARVIGEGMASGDSPRVVARSIRKRVGVSQSRALRISRTEINQAHRRARWEESESSSHRLGLTTRLMHLSALLVNTRKSHALRHGLWYTRKEVEDWYQINGNAINCRCSQVEIMIDADGMPVDMGFVRRVQADGEVFFQSIGSIAA